MQAKTDVSVSSSLDRALRPYMPTCHKRNLPAGFRFLAKNQQMKMWFHFLSVDRLQHYIDGVFVLVTPRRNRYDPQILFHILGDSPRSVSAPSLSYENQTIGLYKFSCMQPVEVYPA